MTNTASATTFLATRQVGQKYYELKDQLGNIRAVVTDKRTAAGDVEVASASNYYPFGMLQPGNSAFSKDYRFGFNGKEMDNDLAHGADNMYDYGFRIYNPRIAKFLSVDPLTKGYPMLTPYQYASNRPIDGIDLDGLEHVSFMTYWYDETGEHLANESVTDFDLQNANEYNKFQGLIMNREDVNISDFNDRNSTYVLALFKPLHLAKEPEEGYVKFRKMLETAEVVPKEDFTLAGLGWTLDNSIQGHSYGDWKPFESFEMGAQAEAFGGLASPLYSKGKAYIYSGSEDEATPKVAFEGGSKFSTSINPSIKLKPLYLQFNDHKYEGDGAFTIDIPLLEGFGCALKYDKTGFQSFQLYFGLTSNPKPTASIELPINK